MTTSLQPKHDVKDLSLAVQGKQRITWVGRQMPVLRQIQDRFSEEKPLSGIPPLPPVATSRQKRPTWPLCSSAGALMPS